MYDDEGRRVSREHLTTHVVNDYEWDHRGRLVKFTTWTDDSRTDLEEMVEFRYDAFNRRIAKLIDSDGNETFDAEQHYVYDQEQIVLLFNAAGDLTNRLLPGPEIDQVMSDERLSELITDADRIAWPMADNQHTVRENRRHPSFKKNLLAGA